MCINNQLLYLLDDWRCDQYRWSQNGRKRIPKKDPVLIKTYFVNVALEGSNVNFRRHAYTLIDDVNGHVHKTLIHYLGDHTSAIDFPHGNAKHEKIHVRTCPSTLQAISNDFDIPSNAYKKEITDCLPAHQPVLKPKNVKQISNNYTGKK